MHPRVRLTLMTVVTLVLLTLLGLVVFSGGSDAGRDAAGTARFAGAIYPPAAPAPAFMLRDQDGRPRSPTDARGQVVVLTFMYTTCQNDCPTMAQQIRGAIDQVRAKVPVLAISVDPANDTPARARRFVAEQHLGGRMRFLLGDQGSLQPIWRSFGIQPQGDLEHSARVVLLDRRGRPRVGFPISELTPEGLAHDIGVLLREP